MCRPCFWTSSASCGFAFSTAGCEKKPALSTTCALAAKGEEAGIMTSIRARKRCIIWSPALTRVVQRLYQSVDFDPANVRGNRFQLHINPPGGKQRFDALRPLDDDHAALLEQLGEADGFKPLAPRHAV